MNLSCTNDGFEITGDDEMGQSLFEEKEIVTHFVEENKGSIIHQLLYLNHLL